MAWPASERMFMAGWLAALGEGEAAAVKHVDDIVERKV
jgi:hypothetical protein